MKDKRKTAAGLISIVIGAVIILIILTGCSTCCLFQDLSEVEYTPRSGSGWEVSTPEAEGLDPMLVARMYCSAARLNTIYSLLVIKNGKLIAEDYWHGSGPDQKCRVQSVTKSYTSALAGIALEKGDIDSVYQPMMDFFPELAGDISDPRKMDITVQQLLQMRAGYPWEEASPELFNVLWYEGFKTNHLVSFPLVRDPGTGHDYSNFSSHLLGIIISRAAGKDLLDYANENLFSFIDTEDAEWDMGWEDYRMAFGGLRVTARDMAKFGQLYLNGGVYNGTRVLPEQWVTDSLKTYSEDAWYYRIGANVNDMGYGYQWWSLRSGNHQYNMAWGHGGQLIMLLQDLNMIVVLTADPFAAQSDDQSWRNEKANINLVADFIASLPEE